MSAVFPGSPVRPGTHVSAWSVAASAAVALFLAAHGAVHGMGVALLWKLGEPGNLRYADAVPTPGTAAGYAAGAAWLVAGLLLVAAAVALLGRRPAWRLLALTGALLSAAVISLDRAQAPAGLVADAVVVLIVVADRVLARRRAREVA